MRLQNSMILVTYYTNYLRQILSPWMRNN